MPSLGHVGRPLGVGVVGLGYWGPNLLRVLADDPQVEVRWICDRDPERVARFEHRHPLARTAADVGPMLEDPGVEAVVIATPVGTHFELGAACLAAGKHTFIEKPLAADSALAAELLALAARAGRLLMCGHTFLYSPPVRAVRRLVEARALGDLYFVSSSRVNLGPYRRDVSVVWDLGPHDFSILRYWFGEPPLAVQATGRDALASGIADIAFVAMTFPHGIVANVELSWLAPCKLRRTVLVGSDKMVVYEDGAAEPLRVYDRGIVLGALGSRDYRLSYRSGDVISPQLDGREPLAAELGDFVAAIRRDDPLEWQGELAHDVVRITEAAERSLRLGGVAVPLAQPATDESTVLRARAAALPVEEPAA